MSSASVVIGPIKVKPAFLLAFWVNICKIEFSIFPPGKKKKLELFCYTLYEIFQTLFHEFAGCTMSAVRDYKSLSST